MKPETSWRTKLIREFKKAHPDGFIWAMDAKFKAGFPDLLVILNGKSFYFELKVIHHYTNGRYIPEQIKKLCQPVQISVLRSMGQSGAVAGIFVLETLTQNVCWLNPWTGKFMLLYPSYFKQLWDSPQFFTGILK